MGSFFDGGWSCQRHGPHTLILSFATEFAFNPLRRAVPSARRTQARAIKRAYDLKRAELRALYWAQMPTTAAMPM
jgi:hypothetical protein